MNLCTTLKLAEIYTDSDRCGQQQEDIFIFTHFHTARSRKKASIKTGALQSFKVESPHVISY